MAVNDSSLERFYNIGYGIILGTYFVSLGLIFTLGRSELLILLWMLNVAVLIEDYLSTMQLYTRYKPGGRLFFWVNVLYLILLWALFLPMLASTPARVPATYPLLFAATTLVDILYSWLVLQVVPKDDPLTRTKLFSIIWGTNIPSFILESSISALVLLGILSSLFGVWLALLAISVFGFFLAQLCRWMVDRVLLRAA